MSTTKLLIETRFVSLNCKALFYFKTKSSPHRPIVSIPSLLEGQVKCILGNLFLSGGLTGKGRSMFGREFRVFRDNNYKFYNHDSYLTCLLTCRLKHVVSHLIFHLCFYLFCFITFLTVFYFINN